MGGFFRFKILVCRQAEAQLLLYTQHIGKLEEATLIRRSAGFSHTDKAAAIIDELPNHGAKLFILPDFTTGPGGTCIPCVQDDINVFWNSIFQKIGKGEEFHLHCHTGQGFQNTEIAVNLLIIQGVRHHVSLPGTNFSPGIQDGYLTFIVGFLPFYFLMNCSKFLRHLFHGIQKGGELVGQAQISAVADAVNGTSENGPSCANPVFYGFLFGMHTGGEAVREEVGKETPFGITDSGNVGNQTKSSPSSHASHHAV